MWNNNVVGFFFFWADCNGHVLLKHLKKERQRRYKGMHYYKVLWLNKFIGCIHGKFTLCSVLLSDLTVTFSTTVSFSHKLLSSVLSVFIHLAWLAHKCIHCVICERGWELNSQGTGELKPDLSHCICQLLHFSVSLHLSNRLATIEKHLYQITAGLESTITELKQSSNCQEADRSKLKRLTNAFCVCMSVYSGI